MATPVAREGRARTPPMGEARGLSNVCLLILLRRSRRSAAHPTGRAPAGSSQQCKYGERLQEGGRRWRATACVQPPPGFGRRRATEAHLALPTPTSAGGLVPPRPAGLQARAREADPPAGRDLGRPRRSARVPGRGKPRTACIAWSQTAGTWGPRQKRGPLRACQ